MFYDIYILLELGKYRILSCFKWAQKAQYLSRKSLFCMFFSVTAQNHANFPARHLFCKQMYFANSCSLPHAKSHDFVQSTKKSHKSAIFLANTGSFWLIYSRLQKGLQNRITWFFVIGSSQLKKIGQKFIFLSKYWVVWAHLKYDKIL